MTTFSNLSRDLVGEILSKVPITSVGTVRCTCKRWNTLSKHHRIVGEAVAAKQCFMGFMMMDYRVCSVRYDLNGMHKEEDDDGSDSVVAPSIKQIGKLNQIEISSVFHCDGLLLCVTKDKTRLLVWNPYLGQTRWIEPNNASTRWDRYALGYDKKKKSYKVLRFVDEKLQGTTVFGYEIYDLNSNSWRVLDVTSDWDIEPYRPGVSLKGNTYFFAKEKIGPEGDGDVVEFLLSFDFTKERFGPRLNVPFHSFYVEDIVALSCVGKEKLVVLNQCMDLYEMEIWVTAKIEPEAVSWSKVFLVVDMRPITDFPFHFKGGSFFIDEEKKLAVVFDLNERGGNKTAYIIGENGYFKQLGLGEAVNLEESYDCPPVCTSYAPSLVQINQGLVLSGKRKQR